MRVQRRSRGWQEEGGWPRYYLGADAVQHAEDDEPREQKGTTHLREHCKSVETCCIVPGNRQTGRGVNLNEVHSNLAELPWGAAADDGRHLVQRAEVGVTPLSSSGGILLF